MNRTTFTEPVIGERLRKAVAALFPYGDVELLGNRLVRLYTALNDYALAKYGSAISLDDFVGLLEKLSEFDGTYENPKREVTIRESCEGRKEKGDDPAPPQGPQV